MGGTVDQAADEAGHHLYQVVSSRLQPSRAADSLQRLRQIPGEPTHQHAIALALRDEIERDPAYRAELAGALRGVQSTTTVTGNANVTNTGSWDNRKGVVATEDSMVDQRRTFNIGIGGLVVAILAAALLLGWATTMTVIAVGGDDESSTPEAAAKAYAEAVNDKDVDRYAALMCKEEQLSAEDVQKAREEPERFFDEGPLEFVRITRGDDYKAEAKFERVKLLGLRLAPEQQQFATVSLAKTHRPTSYTAFQEPAKPDPTKQLVNEDGDWKVC